MKAHWHYYIIDAREIASHLKIEASSGDINFKNPVVVPLPHGQKSYRISSFNSESVGQLHDYSLLLKGIHSGTNREFTLRLPFPNPTHIKVDSRGENHVDIYFYL